MARPSTVRTLVPSAWTANIRQERTGWSSISTVQAPQTPCSQPRCVPVRPQSSRSASAKLRRRRRADRAALADALGAGDTRLGHGFQMMDFEHRDLCHRWHKIIGKRAGQYVAAVVVNHLFVERVGDALGDAAMDLPVDNHG